MELQRWNTYHNLIARAQRGVEKAHFQKRSIWVKKFEDGSYKSNQWGGGMIDLRLANERNWILSKKSSLWCFKELSLVLLAFYGVDPFEEASILLQKWLIVGKPLLFRRFVALGPIWDKNWQKKHISILHHLMLFSLTHLNKMSK